jgi:hypothetical protein
MAAAAGDIPRHYQNLTLYAKNAGSITSGQKACRRSTSGDLGLRGGAGEK